MTRSLSSITTLAIVLFALVTYNFIGAQWTPAPASPPNNNVPAPINVSGEGQVKLGNFGANIVDANAQMRSPKYCDPAGTNCWDPTGGVPGGGGVPAGAVMAFNLSTCPGGWEEANGTGGKPDLRGEFIRGYDAGRGVDPGRALGSFQPGVSGGLAATRGVGSAWPSHKRNKDVTIPLDGTWSAGVYVGEGGSPRQYVSFRNSVDLAQPRNVALLYCVKS